MFTVYVLYSPTLNQIYIGYTSDIENRFLSHNQLATKGYTVKFRPWIIAYTEEYPTKKDAAGREKQLKTQQGRKFVWNLIAQKFITHSGANIRAGQSTGLLVPRRQVRPSSRRKVESPATASSALWPLSQLPHAAASTFNPSGWWPYD